MFIAAVFTIAKIWKQPRLFQSRNCCIYTQQSPYLVIRNNGMWFEGKWMQLEDIILSEVSQTQKDKDHLFSLINGRQIQKLNIYTKISMII
jgi:hypothetical protein